MKQAILELIAHWHDLLPYTGNARDYMETLYKKIEKMEEWIPVTERLPEERKEVLIYINYSIHTAYLVIKNWYDNWYSGGGEFIWNPTHWINIPISPLVLVTPDNLEDYHLTNEQTIEYWKWLQVYVNRNQAVNNTYYPLKEAIEKLKS